MAVKNYTYDRAELRLFGPVKDELAGQKGVRLEARCRRATFVRSDIARTRVVDLHRA